MPAAIDSARVTALAHRVAPGASPPAPAAVDALVSFGELLLEWNQRINLGGARLEEELVERHFADAFAAGTVLPQAAHLADVGSGGGLPAIPLAVLRPDLAVELFEPTAKKVAFLRTAVRTLALSGRVTVHARRVEAPLPAELAARFDAASSRATFDPRLWLLLGRGLVRPGGKVLVFATGHEAPPLPPAVQALRYGPDRQLLVYD